MNSYLYSERVNAYLKNWEYFQYSTFAFIDKNQSQSMDKSRKKCFNALISYRSFYEVVIFELTVNVFSAPQLKLQCSSHFTSKAQHIIMCRFFAANYFYVLVHNNRKKVLIFVAGKKATEQF